MSKFSKGAALSCGWRTVTGNLRLFLGIAVFVAVLSLIPNILPLEKGSFLAVVITLVIQLFTVVISIGITKVMLRIHDGEPGRFGDIFAYLGSWRILGYYILGAIIYAIITGIGVLLLIIPGIYLGLRLQFYTYLIVDREMGPVEALKKSWEITKGSAWNLFLFGLLVFGIVVLGMLALGVGLLLAVPVTMMTTVSVYRHLLTEE